MLSRAGRVITANTSYLTMLNEGLAPYGPAKAALAVAAAIWAKAFGDTGVSVNVLIPGGPTDTPMAPPSAPFARKEPIPPVAMTPPALWLAHPPRMASRGAGSRRRWGTPALPPEQAAEAAGGPIAWPGLTTADRVWPER